MLKGRLQHIAVAVIPMGWISAVTVCQHIHRNILRARPPVGAGLPSSRELRRGHRPPHDDQ
eukprot:1362717-Amphidinium_carterae.1